jgi:hypothetical protein
VLASNLFEPPTTPGIENSFRRGFGLTSGTYKCIATSIDPTQFRITFGPTFQGATETFAFKGKGEWIFHTNDEIQENIKATLIDGKIVIAVISEETIAKFLAFVDYKNQASTAGG